MKNHQIRSPILGYGFAVSAVAVSIVLRYALMPLLGKVGYEYVTVFPAIIVVATFASRGPAILASVLGSLIAEYCFTPGLAFSDITGIGIVILTGFLAGWLAQRLHDALTQSKAQATALAESEEHLRNILDGLIAFVGVMLPDGTVTKANRPALEIANLKSEDVVGKKLWDCYWFNYDRGIQRQVRQAVEQAAKGEPVRYDITSQIADGKFIIIDFAITPMRDEKGMLTYLIPSAIDITDRKRAEQVVHREQTFLRNVIDATPSMVFVKDWDGRFVLVNKALAFCYGTTIDGIVGKTDSDFNANAEEVAHFLRDDREVMSTQLPKFIAEEPVTCADGRTRWFATFKVPLIDKDGACNKVLGVATDITDRKRIEDALRESEERLRAQTKELETIIAIVSHDLRAPLVNVRGFAHEIGKDCARIREAMQKEPSCRDAVHKLVPIFESFPESINFIVSSAEAMDNLAISLVSVARAGLGAIRPEQVDMNEVIRKVVASIQFKFKQSNAAYDIDANLPSCFGDKTQITQIFANLLDNAVKYLDPDRPGQICVGCDIQVGHAMYWVSDNGIGISPYDQEKIFDPYYQLHEKAAEGVGLGLATVKRMVDRNNGKIWVDSEKGKSTTFYIALPITPH